MSTTVNYKGNTIATVNNATKTLSTAGTWVEGDITLVDNSTPNLQSKSVSYTPSESAQTATVTADSGYDGLGSVAVSVGAISGTYVGSQVPTQAAQTIHPSTTAQTIASGKYLTGDQTIEAVTTTNLTAANIKSGVVVKVGSATDDDSVLSVTGTAETGGGNIGGLAEMVDVSNVDYSFGYMLSCFKAGNTVGGRVTYTSAFPNTETKILETGLTTIHGIMFARPDIRIGTNVDGQPVKTIFIFVTSDGTLDIVGMHANGATRAYGQAQGTVYANTPLNGAVRFNGGDMYYTGRYNKNAAYQMLKVNVQYEWIAW